MVQVHPPEDRAGSVHESPVRRVVRPGPMHGGSPGAPVAGARQCPVLHRGAVAHLVLPELVVVPQGCGVRRSVRRFRRGGRPQPRGRGKVHGVGGGSSKTQRAGSLLAAIGARLGTRVQLAEVVARLTATSCWCTSAYRRCRSRICWRCRSGCRRCCGHWKRSGRTAVGPHRHPGGPRGG